MSTLSFGAHLCEQPSHIGKNAQPNNNNKSSSSLQAHVMLQNLSKITLVHPRDSRVLIFVLTLPSKCKHHLVPGSEFIYLRSLLEPAFDVEWRLLFVWSVAKCNTLHHKFRSQRIQQFWIKSTTRLCLLLMSGRDEPNRSVTQVLPSCWLVLNQFFTVSSHQRKSSDFKSAPHTSTHISHIKCRSIPCPITVLYCTVIEK